MVSWFFLCTGNASWGSLSDETQLARVGEDQFGLFEVVVGWVEATDELVQPEGRVPDLEQQVAALASADDPAGAIHGGIVPLVAGAAAVELA